MSIKQNISLATFIFVFAVFLSAPFFVKAEDSTPLATIDSLQQKVTNVLPANVISKALAWFAKIDVYRQQLAQTMIKNRDVINEKLNQAAVQQAKLHDLRDNPTADNIAEGNNIGDTTRVALLSPGEYVELYAYDIGIFVVDNIIFFYAVVLVIIAVLVRQLFSGLRKS